MSAATPYASFLTAAGYTLRELMEYVGHSSLQAAGRYVKLLPALAGPVARAPGSAPTWPPATPPDDQTSSNTDPEKCKHRSAPQRFVAVRCGYGGQRSFRPFSL
jgi:hypothetical protein